MRADGKSQRLGKGRGAVSEGEGKLSGFEKRTWREWGPGSPGRAAVELAWDWEEVARAPTRTVTLQRPHH